MNRASSSLLVLSIFLCSVSVRAQIFTDNSDSAGIDHICNSPYLMGGGVAFFDYDQDGDEDLYMTSGFDRDHLYENDGLGNFTEVGMSKGLSFTDEFFTFGVICGDIDNDGDKDVFLTTFLGEDIITEEPIFYNNKLLLNNGGQFTDISIQAGITDSLISTSATFIDVNLDGYLDVYVINYVEEESPLLDSNNNPIGYSSTCFVNHLYLNNQDNTFTESANTFGLDHMGCGLAVASTDFNNDQNTDIYLANDFGYWLEPNVMFENTTPGFALTNTGSSLGADIGMFGMGIAVGDFDEDLDLDYYITNIGPNALLENDINNGFTDVSVGLDVTNDSVSGFLTTGWGAEFLDVDNDTYLDLLVANGHIPMPEDFFETSLMDPNKLYLNDGSGGFIDASIANNVADSSMSHGLAYGDINNDGFLDFVTVNTDTNITSNNKSKLFVNTGGGNNWIKLKLEGTISNRDAYGSHVVLYADGRSFLREVSGGASHASHSSSTLHFGLSTISFIDSIEIYWPSKLIETVYGKAVNETLNFLEGSGIVSLNEVDEISFSIYPNPTKGVTNLQMNGKIQSDVNISIFDCYGRVVFQQQVETTNLDNRVGINLNYLSAGLYTVSLSTSNGKLAKTLIIE
jgi:hypothetical protein